MLSMDSEYVKREKFREAITIRLIQLSKQCDEICSSSPSSPPKRCAPDFQPIIEDGKDANMSFQFPAVDKMSKVDTGPKNKSTGFAPVSLFPLFVNNFVSPTKEGGASSYIRDTTKDEQNAPSIESSKNLVECPSVTLTPSQISLCVDTSSDCPALATGALTPDSVFSPSECESGLLAATPSTDLDRYMDSSADTYISQSPVYSSPDYSPSTEGSPESLENDTKLLSKAVSRNIDGFRTTEFQVSQRNNTRSESTDTHSSSSCSSNVTLDSNGSQESQTDRITVVSLTSDTDSATSEHGGEVLVERGKICVGVEETKVKTPEPVTPRRRRLSYTLECASPVLTKALKDGQVGPRDDFASAVQNKGGSLENLGVSPLPADSNLQRGPRTAPNSPSKSIEGKKAAKSKIPVITSQTFRPPSLLQASDQQFANMELKNQELREYLGQLSVRPASRVSLTYPVKHAATTDTTPPIRGSSPQQTSHDLLLQSELKALRQETAQQRHLLELQEQMLQSMAERQEQLYQRLQESQQRLVSDLHRDIQRHFQEMFAQQRQESQRDTRALHDAFRNILQETLDGSSQENSRFPVPSGKIVNISGHSGNRNERTTSCLLSLTNDSFSPHMKRNFDRLSATVKGYLTRRLLRTEKVQSLIQTIQDTMECALRLHEVANRSSGITKDDADLHQRLINQVTSACYDFHDVFFKYSSQERMLLIAQSRQLAREKASKMKASNAFGSGPYISAATKKSLERKNFVKCKSASPAPGSHKKQYRERKRCSTVIGYEDRPRKSTSAVVTQTHHRRSSAQPFAKKEPKMKQVGLHESRSPSFFM